jgi:hypothetical protein
VGSFTDPGADPWTATVDYGDGTGRAPLALAAMGFTLDHTYGQAGVFTVDVQVSDDHATAERAQTVTVISHAQAVQEAIALVDQLVAAGKLDRGSGRLIQFELGIAAFALRSGQPLAAELALDAVVTELDLLARFRRLSAADAAPLRTQLTRLIRSVSLLAGERCRVPA